MAMHINLYQRIWLDLSRPLNQMVEQQQPSQ